jgi:hypothetical protein
MKDKVIELLGMRGKKSSFDHILMIKKDDLCVNIFNLTREVPLKGF